MVRILLSNDDGYLAPGIRRLYTALAEFSEVVAVAPDRNKSGASHSLTLDRPLRAYTDTHGFTRVDGTPGDCVQMVVMGGFLDFKPDLVVSGINAGPNLGDDVLYSGTVAAAMEGRYLGYPGVAFSLAGKTPTHYDTAAAIASKIIKRVLIHPLPPMATLNVNIPDVPFKEVKGILSTRLGRRHQAEPGVHSLDQRGERIYWLGSVGEVQNDAPGTDFHAIENSFVSITPLQVDLTEHTAQQALKGWLTFAM